MRVLVFGASITQGYWDLDGGWVDRLRRYYDQQKILGVVEDPPTVFNLGISADTVQDISKRFKSETEARKRHGKLAFVFCIGTNNAAEGLERKFDPDEYRDDLKSLLTMAREYSDLILLVGLPSCDEAMTTPVSWRDVHYTNERIKKIEDQIRLITQEQNISFVPVFEKFKAAFEKEKDLLFDGLHPNNKGHRLIANLVLPELEKLLK